MPATLRVEVFPAEIDRAVAFYTTLGFTVTRRHEGPPMRYASMQYGQVRLGLAEREPADPALRMLPIGTEIVVDVDDVRAERDRVVAAGIPLLEDLVTREWGLTDFRLTDPDGFYWRFTSRD
jgi:uncharacterized glyoxalase superfamily protein PhnB